MHNIIFMLQCGKLLNYLFVLNLFYCLSNCQIILPLTYFPKYKYNYSTPLEIMKNLLRNKIFADIDIGTPRKTAQLSLAFGSNDFYIGELGYMSKDRFTDLKFYNVNSTSKKELVDDEDYVGYGEIFYMGYLNSDFFYFNDKSYNFNFYMAFAFQGQDDGDSGGIGLQLPKSDTERDKKKTFIGNLKKYGLINNYYWSIYFNSNEVKKEETATFLLGIRPHEYDGVLGKFKKGTFDESQRRTTNLNFFDKNKISIDGVYAYEGGNDQKLIEDFPNGNTDFKKFYLDYEFGGIEVPGAFQKYYHRIFEEHIIAGICFNKTLTYFNAFYYCQKDESVLSKIKKAFPKLVFQIRDLNYNFTLDYNDIIHEEEEYFFFLLYFGAYYSKDWIMGKPFLRKYVFVFNYNENILDFYDISAKKPSKGISLKVLIIAIVGTVVVVLIICFLLFKFVLYNKFFKKKKRANELDDGDYEYTAKEDAKEDAKEEANKLGINF